MKELKYIIMVLTCTLLASCMGDDYDAPDLKEPPYGNKQLTETNVLTIKQLKAKYNNAIASNGVEEITEDAQIKGWVTGNDIEGNLYNQFALQDETGAIIISVEQGALYGHQPVGQEVLISLKGLKIGGNGNQGQMGGVYTNKKTGQLQVGRLNRYVWERHYKLIGSAQPGKIKSMVFDTNKMSDGQYMAEHCGMLMTLKNVRLEEADGKTVFAPNDHSITLTANAANRTLTGISSKKMVVRTSTYADFANQPMPTGTVNITGIFTRFGDTWQILPRTANDVKPAK